MNNKMSFRSEIIFILIAAAIVAGLSFFAGLSLITAIDNVTIEAGG